jgi:pimeloyl-ACP methyl ester carboxylesterase
MQLHFESYGQGQGPPLIILHGLFGSLENWHSISSNLAANFRVLAVDQRNHGRSPHTAEMSFQLMAEDLRELLAAERLGPVNLLGHSMGGKTAMLFALDDPDLVEKLIVVDMAPRAYPPHHREILNALLSLDLRSFKTRAEMESQLAPSIPDLAVRQFLLKNVKRDQAGIFYWQMNLAAIEANYHQLSEEIARPRSFDKPALFIRGERSDYIRDEDMTSIRKLFPQSKLCDIAAAGHWVHAEKPDAFLRKVREFLK